MNNGIIYISKNKPPDGGRKNEFNAILKLIKKENIDLLNDIELINKHIEELQNIRNHNSKKVISSKIGTTLLPGVGTVVLVY